MEKIKFSVKIIDENASQLKIANSNKSMLDEINTESFIDLLEIKESQEDNDSKSLKINDIITVLGKHYRIDRIDVTLSVLNDDNKELETRIWCSNYALNKL